MADVLALELALDDQLRHVVHDLRPDVMQVEELHHGLRVARVLSIHDVLKVVLEASLAFLEIAFVHEDLLARQKGQVRIAHAFEGLVQLQKLRIPLTYGV